jgi:hypothetical protein
MEFDYDIVFPCACCGEKSTNYLCGRCSKFQCVECAALRARVAVLEKVAEAAIAGPCRHTSDYKGTDCPLRAALDALKEGK